MNIAKGIQGIRTFTTGPQATKFNFGWHVTTKTEHLFFSETSGVATVNQMNREGYQLIGIMGNVLCFEKE